MNPEILAVSKPNFYTYSNFVRLLANLKVRWRNWKVRDISKAYRTLSKAMQEDPDFARSWQANIAMPIYDATRPMCTCNFDPNYDLPFHEPQCPVVFARDVDNRPMDIRQANAIANRLMAHLFSVHPKKS